MTRGTKWALGLGIPVAVLAMAGFAVARWLPTTEEIAGRLKAEAEKRLGVEVSIGSISWELLPRPGMTVSDIRTKQPQPIVIGHLTATLKISAMLDRRLVLDTIAIQDATFPRDSVRALRKKTGERAWPDHFTFRNATWISYSGIPVTYDGDGNLDSDGYPRRFELRRPGSTTPFTFRVVRDGDAPRWQTHVEVGGGTMHGRLEVEPGEGGEMRLSGKLAPRDVEVESTMKTFNRRSVLSGKASGETVVSGRGETAGEILRSVQTSTRFSVSSGTALRFDLEKAIHTLGEEKDGETALDELTGRLDTQNTDEGMRAVYTNLKARSGVHTATGQATIYRRQVEASGIVFVGEDQTKVPFTLSGPVAKPKASVPAAAMALLAVRTGNIGTGIKRAFSRALKGKEETEK